MTSFEKHPPKRKRQDDSPEELCKNIDVCHHCSKKCSKKNEAIQCDLCYAWLHASCEGLSKDKYKLLTRLTSSVDNVMYFCKYNKCETRSKQLMFGCISKVLFPPTDSSNSNEASSLTTEQDTIRKELSDLSKKVNALCSMNKYLQQEIKSTASIFVQSSLSTTQSISATLNVIDEISDRNRRYIE